MRELFVALVLVAGCNGDKEPPPPPAGKPEPAPAPLKLDDSDLGSCTVKTTGGGGIEATSRGGKAAVSSKYWMSDGEQGAVPAAGLVINCSSDQLRLSIVTKPDVTVPFAPKTYSTDRKAGDLLVLGRVGATSLTDFIGTLDVTAFDGKHVAGTIALSAKGREAGAITFDGQFDFKCPGYGNCGR